MNENTENITNTTFREIARHLNSEKLDEDILVFDSDTKFGAEEIFPLRIDALLITLCKEGTGKIGIDLHEYEIKKNTLIIIQPRNYIYISDYSEDFKCSVIACSHHVVEDVLPKLTDLLPLLMHRQAEPVIYLSESEAVGITHFYDFIRQKLSGPKTPFLKQKVLCMLQSALYEMMDINMKDKVEIETQRTRKEEIVARFILVVSEHFRKERQVAFYAEKLCITPKHLSTVVKEITNRTAGDWIENYVVMEAKVLLKTTDMTIQEISDYLNFANQSFFGKYFKTRTGFSPTTYRKTHS